MKAEKRNETNEVLNHVSAFSGIQRCARCQIFTQVTLTLSEFCKVMNRSEATVLKQRFTSFPASTLPLVVAIRLGTQQRSLKLLLLSPATLPRACKSNIVGLKWLHLLSCQKHLSGKTFTVTQRTYVRIFHLEEQVGLSIDTFDDTELWSLGLNSIDLVPQKRMALI